MQTLQTISKDELKVKLDRMEDFQLVNVLEPKFYALGMIPGSLKIPAAEIAERQGELDKNREVVTYCASPDCSASRDAARKLSDLGFDAKAYEGGIREWKASGFPLE